MKDSFGVFKNYNKGYEKSRFLLEVAFLKIIFGDYFKIRFSAL
jgi:hypothetical protein